MDNKERDRISSEEIAGYYDSYTEQQQQTGTNLRHYYLIHRMKKAGLKRHYRVLEVGCGIGTLTGLIHRYVSRGHIVAVDISAKSIEMARTRFSGRGRIEFVVTDMQDFSYPEKFDFIVLPDVLEHIPIAQHPTLFATLRAHMHDDSIIFINIPHPRFIEYFREHAPEKLQIIDQPVHADELMRSVYSNNLLQISSRSYSLYNHDYDYIEYIIGSNTKLSNVIQHRKMKIIKNKWFLKLLNYVGK